MEKIKKGLKKIGLIIGSVFVMFVFVDIIVPSKKVNADYVAVEEPIKNEKVNEKEKRVSAAKASKALVSLDFDLNIKKYHVVLADFTISNKSNGELTDIEIRCSHYSPTNALLAKNKKVLYIVVAKNSVKKVKGFTMGVTHSQATKSSCEIFSYGFEGLRVWY